MRVFLLRLFIGWWMVPIFILFGVPLGWLMFGDDKDEPLEIVKFTTSLFWNGEME